VELGAFSPIMRTHHGAFSDEDWQFDSDEATLSAFAHWSQVHTSLFPYLRGLASEAQSRGTPLTRPIFLHYPKEDWGRTDAWLLGPSLLVAPVMEEGALSRSVDLPAGVQWFDWWTQTEVESGEFDAPLDTIPVFAPAGAVVPTYDVVPDSLVPGPLDGLVTQTEADASRLVYVFAGAKGSFVEADGTTYSTDGEATGSGTSSDTFDSGSITAGGLKLSISGPVERRYTVVVADGSSK
jgi:alpha-glucosidase (family GH31 glycosyl hydrolase)